MLQKPKLAPSVARESVSIRPGVSILSVLRHLNYKPWFAIAEFVDNSVQSYLAHRNELENVEGESFKLRVEIELDPLDGGRITVRDNAAGIYESEYHRAFRPAETPPDRSGLAEFGMGMKSAACWFSRVWTVRTAALGEGLERTVRFDIDKIVRDDLEELDVNTTIVASDAHYTEIILSGLHRPPQRRTIGKVKDHLASIYRIFIRDGILELVFDRELLSYSEVPVLFAPYFRDPSSGPQRWHKPVDLDFGLGLRAHGFAALREKASVSTAGFALFRRNRLIEGSADEPYRPEFIFGKPNSYTYQRLFGELHLQGFEISHTKDGFRWEEHEEIVLEELKKALDAEPLPLLGQAEGYRSRIKDDDVRPVIDIALRQTAVTVEREVPPVVQRQLDEAPDPQPPEAVLPPALLVSRRAFEIELPRRGRWRIELELSNDPAIGEWVDYWDKPTGHANHPDGGIPELGVRLSLAHPFTQRFAGADGSQIEPLLRLAVAIVLAEKTAREGGVRYAGVIRRRINELLRDALWKP